MRRFFLDKSKLDGENVLIDGSEYLHLNKVLRINAGEQVIVSFGDEYEHIVEIYQTYKDHAFAKVKSSTKCDANPHKNLTVFQAVLKGDKQDFLCQKLCELGVRRLVLFDSDFTNGVLDDKKLQHLKNIAVSASKQCGRSDVMEIEYVGKFEKTLNLFEKFEKVVFAYENERQTRFNRAEIENLDNVCAVIGSEGGFSEKEAQAICNLKNATCITLGKRILRAETASIVIATLVMNAMGEI